jgi:hypothetical protein
VLNPDRKYSLLIDPVDYEPGEAPEGANLTQLADFYKTDKGTIKHLYTPVYERWMKDKRLEHVDLLEIGVACGCSLKMWHEYFPIGTITGVDNRPECKSLCKDYKRIEILITDATKWNPEKQYDFVIDDGSHVSVDIVKTWENLWPTVKPGGLYIIEDLRCTHDAGYLKTHDWNRPSDDFNRRHIMVWLDGLMKRTDYRQTDIDFIHYHREMFVIGKKPC